MNKIIIAVLIIFCIIGFSACRNEKVDTVSPVFRTEDIVSITLFSIPDHWDGIKIPDEYMDEMTKWIASFRISGKAKDVECGVNMITFTIEYSDGTKVHTTFLWRVTISSKPLKS